MARSKEREEYMGKLESCQLWPLVVALKPSACLQTFLCRQHIGSMDDCGLELVWEIQCNSINILSLHIAADSVKRTKVIFCFSEVRLQIPVIRNFATKHWNISNRIIWKSYAILLYGFHALKNASFLPLGWSFVSRIFAERNPKYFSINDTCY